MIHPTAIVDPKAEIGRDVAIGPFCIVGAHVVLQRVFEDDDFALIGFAVDAVGGVGVGDVFRNDIQPRAFGVEGGDGVLDS